MTLIEKETSNIPLSKEELAKKAESAIRLLDAFDVQKILEKINIQWGGEIITTSVAQTTSNALISQLINQNCDGSYLLRTHYISWAKRPQYYRNGYLIEESQDVCIKYPILLIGAQTVNETTRLLILGEEDIPNPIYDFSEFLTNRSIPIDTTKLNKRDYTSLVNFQIRNTLSADRKRREIPYTEASPTVIQLAMKKCLNYTYFEPPTPFWDETPWPLANLQHFKNNV